MRGKPIRNLTGQRFGRLIVIGIHRERKGRLIAWNCLCDCGGLKEGVLSGALLRNRTVSCGCYSKERHTKHGLNRTPVYVAYFSAKARCSPDAKPKVRRNYADRGIEFRFTSVEEFAQELGPQPTPRHTVDRKNNNGHYEKGNVRWATMAEQARNKRSNRKITWNGETRTIAEWGRLLGHSISRISGRLRAGWSEVDALTKPAMR